MILDTIVENKKIRLLEHKKNCSFQEMRRQAETVESGNRSFGGALKKEGISIIGEFKLGSPSLGRIDPTIPLAERILDYNEAVDAISCLTEEDHFFGHVSHFSEIRKQTALPMIRKDFMIDEYQFFEAKAIGADAILLIAAILDDVMLKDFFQLSKELGLDALVEVHDENELERAILLDADIIGINNRDLRDFTIHLETTKQLKKEIPKDRIVVSESGIVTDEDVRFLKDCGVDAFLIGRALMESTQPREIAKRWKEL